MFSSKLSLLVFFLPALSLLSLAAPAPEPGTNADLVARQTVDTSQHCGQWDTVNAGPYTMFLDLWGKDGASSGSQCSQITSLSGSTIAWKTTWKWVGGNGVKSFSNIQLNQGINKQLSQIKSMPVSSLFAKYKKVIAFCYDTCIICRRTGNGIKELQAL